MSNKAVGFCFDLRSECLTPGERFILLAYADHADHAGESIFPSIGLIAAKTGYSERTIQRSTRKFETLGILISAGPGPRGTNKWRMNLDWTAPDMETEITVGGDTHVTPDTVSPLTPASPGGVTSTTGGGDTHVTGGVTPMSPEPPINRHLRQPPEEPSGLTARARPDFSRIDYSQAQKIPEIKLYRALTGLNPRRSQWRLIYSALLDRPATTAAALRGYWDEWNERGYNPKSLKWLTEWAPSGVPPDQCGRRTFKPTNGNGNGHQSEAHKYLEEIING